MRSLASRFPATAVSLGNIDLAADDWPYASLPGGHIEIDDAVHGTVVGNSQAVHAQFPGSGDELRYATHTVEQAVFGMDVKVGELLRHRLDYSICSGGPERGISNCPEISLHSQRISPCTLHFYPYRPAGYPAYGGVPKRVKTKCVDGRFQFCGRLWRKRNSIGRQERSQR
jgi:hypothetical protein